MIYKLIEYITNWQKENDSEFKLIPVDDHSAMIFNMGNQEFKFIFSLRFVFASKQKVLILGVIISFANVSLN